MKNLKQLKEPFVIILVGPPLSGKSTWIRKNFESESIILISRDNILMELSDTDNYTEAFNTVDQKLVDIILKAQFKAASEATKNVIVDMTHMSSKRRKSNLSHFPNHYKVAVIFPLLTEKEYDIRNEKRFNEENKWIGLNIIRNMISNYQTIKEEEGFKKIILI